MRTRESIFKRIGWLAVYAAFLAPIFLAHDSEAASKKVVRYDRERVKRIVVAEARRYQVPADLALAVAHQESGFDVYAKGPVDEIGAMQVRPGTAWGEYGIIDRELRRPLIGIRIGVHFLGRLLAKYNYNVRLTLSHYNGGSRARYGVIPATRSYVRDVLRLRAHYRRLLRKGELSVRGRSDITVSTATRDR
ncbi:MAG: transglycosylase SLT domain-containing protein [Alphaproteobacteria bacterium]|nr:transglycosylase SLT domain-containing protein [Alphaproteobacteria bacterium]